MNGAWNGSKGTGEQALGEARSEEFKSVTGCQRVPPDVAGLYRWLDVPDLGYHDFSMERKASRADAYGSMSSGSIPESGDMGRERRNAVEEGCAAAAPPDEVLPSAGAGAMLPERMPAAGSTRSRWRILHPPAQGTPGRARPAEGAASRVKGPLPPEADVMRAVDVYAQTRPYAQGSEGAGVAPTEEKEQTGNPAGAVLPAWIGRYVAPSLGRKETSAETLKTTRERLAARWFGLRRILQDRNSQESDQQDDGEETFPPMLVLFSLAGGAGKTSLAASLTRALSAQGERVLLVGCSRADVLPMYFGAVDRRPGEPRVFAPPPGIADAPVHVVNYLDTAMKKMPGESDRERAAFLARLRQDSKGFSRVVVDVETGDENTLECLQTLGGSVLVPLLPDMNSLLSVPELQRLKAVHGGTREVWQVLVRFDAAQPLHLDIREVMEQEFAETLLPLSIRHSSTVPEALAQGLTVLDYAPGEGTAQDLLQLAAWVRTLRAPAREGLGQVRWSEQR